MLLLLALSHLSNHGVHALPIPAVGQANEDPNSCDDLHRCRTIWNIVWSCFVVVFSCIWVALHPNIPSPDDKWYTILKRRIAVTLLALIAPELITVWAMRQSLSARKVAKDFSGACKYSYTVQSF